MVCSMAGSRSTFNRAVQEVAGQKMEQCTRQQGDMQGFNVI